MPTFDILPMSEAQTNSATGKRAELIREYIAYIERVPNGQAGQLQASPGETLSAVRRRLGAAGKALDRKLVIRRSGEQVYFWADPQNGPRRRGRPRTVTL